MTVGISFRSLVTLVTALLFGGTVLGQAPPPPQEFQDLYDSMSSRIASFNNAVLALWDGSKSPVTFSMQLASANSNQGIQILAPSYYQKVTSELDGWKAIGVKAATLQVTYPILDPAFDAYGGQSANFLAFYKKVVAEIRSRGLQVIIENTPALSDPSLSSVNCLPFYQSLTDAQYMAGRANHVVLAAQQLAPDYMSVIEEPDTEALMTQKPTFGTPSGSLQLLGQILTAYQPFRARKKAAGLAPAAPLGAGAGVWLPNYNEFIQNFVGTSIDYIDLHVYPVNTNILFHVLTAGGIASTGGKSIAITEAWDLKIRDSELGVLSTAVAYSRDNFSFWAPVDQAFFQSLVNFSHYKKLLFFSPFWGQYFRGYLEYNDQTKGLTPPQLASLEALNVTNNVIQGIYTSTGLAYMNSILQTPDNTPPTSPVLSLGTVQPASVSFTWALSTDNLGVAGYTIYRDGVQLAKSLLQPYTDTTVVDGKSYIYTMTAFDATGNVSPPSSPLSVTTPDITPPAQPGMPVLTVTGSASVSLVWAASADNVAVSLYTISRGSAPNVLFPVGTSVTASYVDTVPNPNTTYCYAVRAADAAGNNSVRGPSACVLVTPQCAADVSPQVSVTRGGYRFNNSTQHFVQSVTVQNISTGAIAGPVSLVLDGLSSNATLLASTGATVCQAPAGSPFFTIDVGSDAILGPAEIATFNLEFINPSRAGITYNTRVLAGGGDR